MSLQFFQTRSFLLMKIYLPERWSKIAEVWRLILKKIQSRELKFIIEMTGLKVPFSTFFMLG